MRNHAEVPYQGASPTGTENIPAVVTGCQLLEVWITCLLACMHFRDTEVWALCIFHSLCSFRVNTHPWPFPWSILRNFNYYRVLKSDLKKKKIKERCSVLVTMCKIQIIILGLHQSHHVGGLNVFVIRPSCTVTWESKVLPYSEQATLPSLAMSHPGIINWNCKLTLFSERGSGGEPPVKSEV